MPYLGFSPEENQRAQENRRVGSVMLTIGWVVLWMAALVGEFVFQDIREGTRFWIVWSGSQGLFGFILVFAGTYYRRRLHA